MNVRDIPFERYRMAVMDNPRKPGEGAMTYVSRIAGIVAGTEPGQVSKTMPETRLPYADRSGVGKLSEETPWRWCRWDSDGSASWWELARPDGAPPQKTDSMTAFIESVQETKRIVDGAPKADLCPDRICFHPDGRCLVGFDPSAPADGSGE